MGGLEAVIAKAKTMLPTITDMKIDSFWAVYVQIRLIENRLLDSILRMNRFYLQRDIIEMVYYLLPLQGK